MFDHGTGIVIGSTAVVGNNVSILHGVTLGGSGARDVDRHPKIGDGVLIGAGTSVLGNVKIGHGVQIGAGSLVIQDVEDYDVVVGVPAKVIGRSGGGGGGGGGKNDRKKEKGGGGGGEGATGGTRSRESPADLMKQDFSDFII